MPEQTHYENEGMREPESSKVMFGRLLKNKNKNKIKIRQLDPKIYPLLGVFFFKARRRRSFVWDTKRVPFLLSLLFGPLILVAVRHGHCWC